MNFLNIIKLSLVGLHANKTRSALTMLGIIIGIASVVIIISVGAGAQSLILDQVDKLGSNLIGILPGAADEEGPPASVFGIEVTTLKVEDAEEILKQVPEVVALASYVRGSDTVTWQNQKKTATFMGVSASYIEVEKTEISSGRFLSPSEDKGIYRIAVLGSKIATDLFSETDPIGQEIKIRRESFKVVGIMKERGTVTFQDPDNQVFLPLETAQKLLLGINHVNLIRAKVNDAKNVKAAIESIKQVLRDRHNITNPKDDDFDVRDQAQAMDILTTITNALKFFLAAIAAISLIVGGIGIMNIMYVVITERTREIGLRKAVGATPGSLLGQFLIEAIIVTLVGGIIGIIIGSVLSGLVAVVANYLGYSWQYKVSLASIIVSLIVAGGIGLVFGYFPARRASALNPIDALRYE